MTTPVGTQNRRTLNAINAVLEGKASKDVQSYQINGRQLYKIPIPELLQLQAVYTQRCLAEQGKSVFSQVRFR